MAPLDSLIAIPSAVTGPDIEDEFELDLRVIESVTPLVTMTCDTSDSCGSTCSTTACSSSSNDPY